MSTFGLNEISESVTVLIGAAGAELARRRNTSSPPALGTTVPIAEPAVNRATGAARIELPPEIIAGEHASAAEINRALTWVTQAANQLETDSSREKEARAALGTELDAVRTTVSTWMDRARAGLPPSRLEYREVRERIRRLHESVFAQ